MIRSHLDLFFPKDGPVRIGVGYAGKVHGGGNWAQDRFVPDYVSSWVKEESVPLRNLQAFVR